MAAAVNAAPVFFAAYIQPLMRLYYNPSRFRKKIPGVRLFRHDNSAKNSSPGNDGTHGNGVARFYPSVGREQFPIPDDKGGSGTHIQFVQQLGYGFGPGNFPNAADGLEHNGYGGRSMPIWEVFCHETVQVLFTDVWNVQV